MPVFEPGELVPQAVTLPRSHQHPLPIFTFKILLDLGETWSKQFIELKHYLVLDYIAFFEAQAWTKSILIVLMTAHCKTDG